MEITEQSNEIAAPKGSPAYLLELAINNKADLQQLEKLMDLQDRYNAGIAKKKYLSAMSKFQNDVPEIKKTKTADFGQGKAKYKFADIADIDKAIKKPMEENGLSKRWEIVDETERLIVTCIISHVDGHSEKTTMSSTKDTSPGKNEIQMRASAITYLKRYTMTSALGITTAEDDVDGAKPKEIQQPVAEKKNENAFTTSDEAKIQNKLAKCKTEKAVIDVFYEYPQYANNIVFKGMIQKTTSALLPACKFASDKERKAYHYEKKMAAKK